MLYQYAMAGLIHRKRQCPYCVIHSMKLIYRADVQYEYIWKCPWCFYQIPINKSSLITQISLKHLEMALNLWVMQARTYTAAKMLFHGSEAVITNVASYFRLFRRAHSHYVENYINPYLVFEGPVEIDESKCNHAQFTTHG